MLQVEDDRHAVTLQKPPVTVIRMIKATGLTCCVLLQANVKGQLVRRRPGGGQAAQVLKDTEQQLSLPGERPTQRHPDSLWYQSEMWMLLG